MAFDVLSVRKLGCWIYWYLPILYFDFFAHNPICVKFCLLFRFMLISGWIYDMTHRLFYVSYWRLVQIMAQQAKLDRAEEIRMELKFLDRIAAEQAQVRSQKHFNICKGILEQTVDLATKIGEFRLLTGKYVTQLISLCNRSILYIYIFVYKTFKLNLWSRNQWIHVNSKMFKRNSKMLLLGKK